MKKRLMGKITFFDLRDSTGRVQIFNSIDNLGEDYNLSKDIKIGDIIIVEGPLYYTKAGEKSIAAQKIDVVSRTLALLPDKFHGLNRGSQYAHRGLDLMTSDNALHHFRKRNKVIEETRKFLYEREFQEVDTSILSKSPTTSKADDFITHSNALDSEVFLRKSYEIRLKQLIMGGFEKIFELGKAFRNESISRVNHPEFTLLELYQTYADYRDMKDLTLDLFKILDEKICKPQANPTEVDDVYLYDFLAQETGVDVSQLPVDKIKSMIPAEDFTQYEHETKGFYIYDLLQSKLKKYHNKNLIVNGVPKEISVLGRVMKDEPSLVEEFRYFVKGDLVANGITELNDYEEQKQRLKEQSTILGKRWDVQENLEFLEVLKYGLAPFAGLGVGIDRIAMVYCDTDNIRDVIYFPL
jgi:lysyl-tRNA synthetase class 2